jgi:5-methylcytosine-specific restriction protein A
VKQPRSFILDPAHTDPARLKREREKARELRASQWWKLKIAAGICHYCGKKFKPSQLTLDHVTPLARGGASTKDNCVPACKSCNTDKGLSTPLDDAFAALEAERRARGGNDSEE